MRGSCVIRPLFPGCPPDRLQGGTNNCNVGPAKDSLPQVGGASKNSQAAPRPVSESPNLATLLQLSGEQQMIEGRFIMALLLKLTHSQATADNSLRASASAPAITWCIS